MSKLQVKIDGEWKELVKVEEVKINGETFENFESFAWDGRTYVKEPLRSSGEVKGNINAKFEEMFKPKCFVANDEIEKEHQSYIDLISDTTFAFIEEAYMNLLYKAKSLHCVGEITAFTMSGITKLLKGMCRCPTMTALAMKKAELLCNIRLLGAITKTRFLTATLRN